MMHLGADQVDGRVEEDPDQIDKVPVDGARFDAPVFLWREMALAPQIPDDDNKRDAAQDVDRVHPRHGKDDCAIFITPRC